jgi:hypothetical protein
MKSRTPIALLVTALCAACGSTGEHKLGPVEFSEQIMMEKWTEFMTPGAAHRVLDAKVGTWDVQVTMYMPDGSSQSSTGTSQIAWIMDGHYLQEQVQGNFGGMPFQGTATTAFDNMKRRYVSSWIDSMGTGIMLAEGAWDPARHAFTFTGEGPDVVRGHYVPVRSVESLLDANHWKVEMWGPAPDGTEMKSMQLVYARRT